MKIKKKDCDSKQKINIENYITKKKRRKENIEEKDIKICPKKIKKTKKYQKINFISFSFNEKKNLIVTLCMVMNT